MAIPRDATPDASLALLREGYDFVGNRCRRLGTDVFATRLLLQPAVCASGADAARTFYGRGLTRRRALPLPILTLLQDLGSVQLLDGEAHRHRKAMFMALMGPASLGRLRAIADEEWQAAIRRWEGAGDVVLLDGAHELLCRVACRWTGIPLSRERSARGRRSWPR